MVTQVLGCWRTVGVWYECVAVVCGVGVCALVMGLCGRAEWYSSLVTVL